MKKLFLISLTALLLAFSCKKDKEIKEPIRWSLKESVKAYERQQPNDTIILKDNAIMIGEDINSIFQSADDNFLTFENKPALDLIEVGDVIYSLPTEQFPEGYAYVIKSKEVVNGQVKYSYDYATLEDIFERLSQELQFKPDFSEKGLAVYDIMSNADNSGGKIDGAKTWSEIIGFDSEKFKGYELNENSASLTYVVYDYDKDYKTEEDQITAKLSLNYDFSRMYIQSDWAGVFQINGTPIVGTSVEFQFGEHKTSPDLNKKLADKFKRELIGKKIPLLTLNLTQMSITSIAVKPTLDVYIVLGLDVEGKLTAKLSYDNTRILFNVRKDLWNQSMNATELRVEKWGTPDFTIEANAEIEASLGVGIGLTLRFPTIEYEKGKESYLGLYTDLTYKGSLSATSGWSLNDGLQCKGFEFSLKPYLKTYIDGKIGAFKNELIDINPDEIEKEILALPLIERSFDFCEDKEDEPMVLPSISTTAISNITKTTATSGGNVTEQGSSEVTERGICWSTTPTPTIINNKTANGDGTGEFTAELTGLTANTTYYVRAYATNSVGTVYGNQLSFKTANLNDNESSVYTGSNPYLNPNKTYGSVTDIEGNVYPTIQIGYQTWMAENLRTTKYNDGTDIRDGDYIVYNYSPEYEAIYGKLYRWSVGASGKLCPQGWHVPSNGEWGQLVTYLENNGGKMKATELWESPNVGATNESGFTALPGGKESVGFSLVGKTGFWCTSTLRARETVYRWSLNYNDNNIDYYDNEHTGARLSCRCIRD